MRDVDDDFRNPYIYCRRHLQMPPKFIHQFLVHLNDANVQSFFFLQKTECCNYTLPTILTSFNESPDNDDDRKHILDHNQKNLLIEIITVESLEKGLDS